MPDLNRTNEPQHGFATGKITFDADQQVIRQVNASGHLRLSAVEHDPQS